MTDIDPNLGDQKQAEASEQEEAPKPEYISKADYNNNHASLRKELAEMKKMIEGVAIAAKPKAAVEEESVTAKRDRRIQALEETLAKRDQEARDLRAFNTATEALSRNNIGNQFIKPALNHLKAEGRIKYDDQGELVFVDSYGIEKDFHSGLTEWSQSDEGKLFQPAKGVQGSGDRARNSPKLKEEVSQNELEQALMSAVMGTLNN